MNKGRMLVIVAAAWFAAPAYVHAIGPERLPYTGVDAFYLDATDRRDEWDAKGGGLAVFHQIGKSVFVSVGYSQAKTPVLDAFSPPDSESREYSTISAGAGLRLKVVGGVDLDLVPTVAIVYATERRYLRFRTSSDPDPDFMSRELKETDRGLDLGLWLRWLVASRVEIALGHNEFRVERGDWHSANGAEIYVYPFSFLGIGAGVQQDFGSNVAFAGLRIVY